VGKPCDTEESTQNVHNTKNTAEIIIFYLHHHHVTNMDLDHLLTGLMHIYKTNAS